MFHARTALRAIDVLSRSRGWKKNAFIHIHYIRFFCSSLEVTGRKAPRSHSRFFLPSPPRAPFRYPIFFRYSMPCKTDSFYYSKLSIIFSSNTLQYSAENIKASLSVAPSLIIECLYRVLQYRFPIDGPSDNPNTPPAPKKRNPLCERCASREPVYITNTNKTNLVCIVFDIRCYYVWF